MVKGVGDGTAIAYPASSNSEIAALSLDLLPTRRKIPRMDTSLFADLHFRYPFRRYQQMILEIAARQEGDRKYHIVAPPGSGKTIVGLELIRRFGRPAVVFAPTTTIQRQWREKVAMFLDEDGDEAQDWLARHTSLDASRLAPLTFLTYQVLSTPGENLEFVERIALERWADDLVAEGQVEDEEAAHRRIETLRQANPKEFRREVSKRYHRIKREFLRREDFDGRQFLHPNARDLIERIVAQGTGTLVLDECHHLLDYWAFILRELIKALPDVRVIGLTATLPDPENKQEYENYYALLGEVDFEVPTPAVVKEGNLAPYRDLVYFCEPSPREHRYLKRIQEYFGAAVRRITDLPAFQNWLRRTLIERRGEDGEQQPFEALFNREPLLCIAGIKFLLAQGVEIPPDIPLVEEMWEPLRADDWLVLLETFALRVLKVSPERELQALYRDLRDVLLPFGITISERGIRHQRSPGDLVLALSESKDAATVAILKAELKAMKERLRAVVITDYERMSARSRRLKDVLDPDAGSAVRVFRRLIADPRTNTLDPILVTGKVVLADADNIPRMEEGIRAWQAEHQARFAWEWKESDDPRIVQLLGSGRDWGSRTYVALITALFERGITRCLVGTRGIFGEGWDALTLNTLIDLTTVTTRTGVQQIRGRGLRLDPSWPRKVAHNWDVVCVSKRFDKGDSDLRRFVARHAHTWGIIVRSRLSDLSDAASAAMGGFEPGMPLSGRIVRGVAHVDLQLATDIAYRHFKRINFDKYTHRMLRSVGWRERVYDLWGVGEPYSNFIYSATQIETADLKFRTVYTVEKSLRAMVWRLLGAIIGTAWMAWCNIMYAIPWSEEMSLPALGLVFAAASAVAVLAAMVLNALGIWRVFRRAFVEMPADAVLLDIGRALLAALRDAGLVSRSLDDKYVRVAETETGGYEVFLDYASPEDSATFARAYRELLGPLGDARYIIARDSTSLRNPLYRPLWLLVRKVLGLGDELHAYHPVPKVLATRRERADALARYWKRYVGGGRLIYTRTEEGRRLLLKARSQQRKRIRQMAFEVWT